MLLYFYIDFLIIIIYTVIISNYHQLSFWEDGVENNILKSVKNESIKKIFNAVASKSLISRLEIAKATDLSLMTVGKVIDSLLNLEILTQELELKGNVGRRAGLLSLNTIHYAIVIDLTERAFTLSVIDLSLRLVDNMTYTYNKSLYYDDNLYLFLKSAAVYINRRRDKDKMIGIGITVPGIYLSAEDKVISTKVPELNTIPIKQIFEELLGQKVSVIMKNVKAAAISGIGMIPEHEKRVIVYMYMGESVDGAVYSQGRFIKGAHDSECDFGRMILRYGEKLENRIQTSRSDEAIANELSSAVYNIVTILDPDAFIIESALPREPDFIVDQIKNALVTEYGLQESRIPEFFACGSNFKHSVRGLGILMRDSWIDTLI